MKITEGKLREMVRGILKENERLPLSLSFMENVVKVVESYAMSGADWHKYKFYQAEIIKKINPESEMEKKMLNFVLEYYESSSELPDYLSISGIQRDYKRFKRGQE